VEQLKEAVVEALTVFAEMLQSPKPITPQSVTAWVAVLASEGVTADEVRGVIPRYLKTSKFYPAPADVLKLLRPPVDEDTRAEAAWLAVRRCLSDYGSYASLTADDLDGDTAALWAVARLGYEELGSVEDRERAFKRTEFLRYYAVALEKGHGLAHLAGRFERENRSRGLALAGPACGRPDWRELPPVVAASTALPEPDEETMALVSLALPARPEPVEAH
jgi:hypothetical protein